MRHTDVPADLNTLSGAVVDAAITVHSRTGPGLLESAYHDCLAHELRKRGHEVEHEVPVPLVYEGVTIGSGYRLDLLVDGELIVEVKAVEEVHPVHVAQLVTYLRLSGRPLGLLLNFNVPRMKDGIRRVLNNRKYSLNAHRQPRASAVSASS